jgi:hypothetical protein
MQELEEARRAKATAEHSIIDEAIRDRGSGYTVFSMVNISFRPDEIAHNSLTPFVAQPVGVLFRPAERKTKNITAKDYLGRAVRSVLDEIPSGIDLRPCSAETYCC